MKRTKVAQRSDRSRAMARLGGVSSAAATRAAHLGLWALLGLTFFAAAVALLRPTPSAIAAVKAPQPAIGAQGFAELYMAAYLGAGKGTEQSLRAFYPRGVDFGDVTPGGVYAGRTTAIDAKAVGPRYWAVTVGVEILFPEEGGLRSGGTRYYQVGVARTDDSYVATALPAVVPAPSVARGPKLALPSPERPQLNDPLAVAVERFAAAFLTGEGELARYTAPSSTLRAVRPPPFAAVEVTAISARRTDRLVAGTTTPAREVLAEVQASDAEGRVQVLAYALELTQRAGRWEVAALLPGPSLADQRRRSTETTTPETNPSAATTTTSLVVATAPTSPTTTAPIAATPVDGPAPAPTERTTPLP